MKSIRSIIAIITIALSVGLSLSSCDNESQTRTTPQSIYLKNQTAKVDINQAVIDSISNLKSEIETISKKSKEAVADVAAMKTSVSKLQDKEIWLWGAIVLIGIVALISFVICLKLYANLQGRANSQNSDSQELHRNKQASSNAPTTGAEYLDSSDDESFHERRACEPETQIRQLKSCSRPIQGPPVSTPVIKVASTKCGYFGNPIQAKEPYFKKLLVSSDSEARFSVEISGDKAIFKPLDSPSYLGTFVSNDAMRVAIDFVGCPTNEASSMQVIIPGEATQRDNNRWFIIKKSKVSLSR